MKFKRNNKRRIVANVEMTPLIDVVFQLLIFFMLSSTFVVQTSIPVEIPEAEGASHLEQKDLVISLRAGSGGPDDEGEIFVDEVSIGTWEELTSTIAEFSEKRSEPNVLFRADTNIKHGRVIRVLGIVTNLGIEHIGFAAQPPAEE